jgi:hypothetical protein
MIMLSKEINIIPRALGLGKHKQEKRFSEVSGSIVVRLKTIKVLGLGGTRASN